MKASQLHTRTLANQGISKPIPFPDGTPTGQFVTILGIDSDSFKKAARLANRERARINELPEDEREDAHMANRNVMMASLVTGWTLEDECTQEAVIDLFENAPEFLKLVDDEANDRSNFFNKPSKS